MQIPIQNIYFLLCYAWNKLEEKDKVKVDIEDSTQLLDLFAKIIINGSKILLKRGIDRSYVNKNDEIAGIKGKLLLADTIKGNLLLKQKTVCSFDELSSDILFNQILITTILRLIRTLNLQKELRNDLRKIVGMFEDVYEIDLKLSHFKQLRLNRNNSFYGFLMSVCKIVLEYSLPSEDEGKLFFKDFTKDEGKMNELFESFIRNFYRIEQSKFTRVRKEGIKWKLQAIDDESKNHLPMMETDITLESAEDKIIIDAKYYRETMSSYYDAEKIHSNNLYQLFSYLLNQESDEVTKSATGILLYPTIEKEYDLEYIYRTHSIKIKTVNLAADWIVISNRLKDIIGVSSTA